MVFKKICFSFVLLTSVEMFSATINSIELLRCILYVSEQNVLKRSQYGYDQSLEKLKKLLKENPNVTKEYILFGDSQPWGQVLPLVKAIKDGKDLELVNIFLQAGADPNQWNERFDYDLCKRLHRHSIAEGYRNSAMFQAAYNCWEAIQCKKSENDIKFAENQVKLLMEFGGNVDQIEWLGSVRTSARTLLADRITNIEKEIAAKRV